VTKRKYWANKPNIKQKPDSSILTWMWRTASIQYSQHVRATEERKTSQE